MWTIIVFVAAVVVGLGIGIGAIIYSACLKDKVEELTSASERDQAELRYIHNRLWEEKQSEWKLLEAIDNLQIENRRLRRELKGRRSAMHRMLNPPSFAVVN